MGALTAPAMRSPAYLPPPKTGEAVGRSYQPYNHDLRLVSPAGNGSGVGTAGGDCHAAIDPVVELWKQPLSRGKQAMTKDADLSAMAVAGEDQVDGIPR